MHFAFSQRSDSVVFFCSGGAKVFHRVIYFGALYKRYHMVFGALRRCRLGVHFNSISWSFHQGQEREVGLECTLFVMCFNNWKAHWHPFIACLVHLRNYRQHTGDIVNKYYLMGHTIHFAHSVERCRQLQMCNTIIVPYQHITFCKRKPTILLPKKIHPSVV